MFELGPKVRFNVFLVLDLGSLKQSSPGTAKFVSYEVILSPRVQNAREPQLTPKRQRVLTRQDIDDKIAAAERRRKVSFF